MIDEKFQVVFYRFGSGQDVANNRVTDFGKFVQTITLPSITFSPQHRTNTANHKLLLTAEYPKWNPIQVTLTDDPEGQMLRLAMDQCQRQGRDPIAALFQMTLEAPKTGRLYTYDECSVLNLWADDQLDVKSAYTPNYVMWVQINNAIVSHHK